MPHWSAAPPRNAAASGSAAIQAVSWCTRSLLPPATTGSVLMASTSWQDGQVKPFAGFSARNSGSLNRHCGLPATEAMSTCWLGRCSVS
ncbi:hypothetical protein ACFQ9X_06225 [Catenulispora yoronensis]